MSGPMNAAECIIPPMPGNVYSYSTSTTHEVETVPDGWKNRYITVFARSADVRVLFGTSNSIEVNAASTPTDDTSATFGMLLDTDNLAGYQFYLDEKITHWAMETPSGSGTIEVVVSSTPSTGVPYQPRSSVGGV